MKLPRRKFLHLAAGAVALPTASRIAMAQTRPAQPPSKPRERPLAERLAAYAHGLRYEELDAATIERVKSHVIDTIGCGIAAFDERPVRICREVALAAGDGISTVIGTNRRTTPDRAAFANAAAFRYYDFNDIYVGFRGAHPSDNIAACFAIAEAERSSGTELVASIVLAYEIHCRLIDAFDLSRNWDAPVFMLPAVALAVGKLMNMDPEKLTQAVNIAINDHIPLGQTRMQTLSDWKGLADAEAARNAIFATWLARGGITGPSPIFEGRAGFFKQVSGPVEIDVEAFGRKDVQFMINKVGVKAYPAEVYALTAIAAAIDVVKEAGSPDHIAAVEVATTRRGLVRLASGSEKWVPSTRETADHSLPYLTARAMFDGDLNNDSFGVEKLRDPRILAFMRKIAVIEDATFTARLGPSAIATRVTATLDDGRRISREVDTVPGFSGAVSRVDAERKFRSNVGKRWSAERTDAILRALWTLDRNNDLSSLLALLRLQ